MFKGVKEKCYVSNKAFMSVQSTGTISIEDLCNVFGVSKDQVEITRFYRGKGVVPDISLNSSVPTSGTISLDNMYGATNKTYYYHNLRQFGKTGLLYEAISPVSHADAKAMLQRYYDKTFSPRAFPQDRVQFDLNEVKDESNDYSLLDLNSDTNDTMLRVLYPYTGSTYWHVWFRDSSNTLREYYGSGEEDGVGKIGTAIVNSDAGWNTPLKTPVYFQLTGSTQSVSGATPTQA